MYRYVLFDLDGTLSDPKVGICTSVQYAVTKMGMEAPDIDELESFIGPPLRDSFMEYFKMSPEEAEQAITYYRERFSTVGKFENELYPGIYELLRDLRKKGRVVAIASSKPTVFVEDILKHFEIRDFFDVVVGSELDGSRDKKEDVLNETLNQMFKDTEIEYDDVVMIGDRKYDIEAALKLGVRNIGVAYGYGSREELDNAGADKIVNTVAGLRAALLPMVGETDNKYRTRTETSSVSIDESGKVVRKTPEEIKDMQKAAGKKAMNNMLALVLPMFVYVIGIWLMKNALYVVISILLVQLGYENDAMYSMPSLYYGVTTASALFPCFIIRKPFIKLWRKEKETELPKPVFKYEPAAWTALIALMGASIAGWGNNIEIEMQKIAASNPQAAANAVNTASSVSSAVSDVPVLVAPSVTDVPLLLGILLFGILKPVTEHFVFTGVSYKKARTFMQPGLSILLVTLLYAYMGKNSVLGFGSVCAYAVTLYAFPKYPKVWYTFVTGAVSGVLIYLVKYCDAVKNLFIDNRIPQAILLISVIGMSAIEFVRRSREIKKEDAVK